MDNWKKIDIKWDQENIINYFQRIMPAKNIRQKEYSSHIFICDIESKEKLEKIWLEINKNIAVYEQSKIEHLIERSNFYICFFVKEKISLNVQSRIEGDTFCAKKYIFLDDCMNLKEKCEFIEKKIFTIDINSLFQSKEKVKKIELNNFRVYEGRNLINLCVFGDKPASFVTIYAPNGTGKTSIFDGLEYTFKGEVGRLKDIPDKEIGAIYHNRNRADENAYVNVELENGKNIKRNVGNVKDGSNDFWKNKLGKEASEIVGAPEKWEQIILPHDKIDNFITAKAGVARYKEWIKSTDIESSISENFSNTHKKMKENEKLINDYNEEIEKSRTKLLELSEQTDKIESWKNLLAEYNYENQEYKLKIPKEVFDENEYDSIMNDASLYIRKHKDTIKICEEKTKIAEKVLKNTVEYYAESLLRIPHHEKQLLGILQKIENRKKYDDLQQKNKYHIEEIQKLEKKLVLIEGIIIYGVEDIKKQKNDYLLRNEQISAYNNVCEDNLQQKNKYQELLEKKREEIKEAKEKIFDEQKNNIIQKKIEEYLKLKSDLVETTKSEEEIRKAEKRLAIEMDNLVESLDKIKGRYIPKTLSELKYQDILNLSDLMRQEIIDNLKAVFGKYQSTIKSIEENQQKNKKFLKNKQDIDNLKTIGQEYINQQQDLTKCPLCHSNFFEWKKLFDAVNLIEKDGDEILQDELKKLREYIIVLNNEYEKICVTYDKIIIALINKENEAIKKNEINRNDLSTKKIEIRKITVDLEEIIDDAITFFKKEKIEILTTKESTIKKWLEQQDKHIMELQVIEKQYQEESKKIQEEEKRIDTMKSIKNDIQNNAALIGYINFLINKPSDYDVVAENQKLKEKMEEEEKVIKKNNQLMSDLMIKEESITYLVHKKEDEQKLLDDDMKLSDECKIFNPLTRDNVELKLSEWKKVIVQLNSNIEILNRILEENGVRNYHKKIKELKFEITNNEEKVKKENNKKNLEKQYEEYKCILQEKLKEYFSQTIISEVFQKIDPHQTMKNIQYEFDINQDEKPELFIRVSSTDSLAKEDSYRPECFFSSAQLNMVAFSSFFSRALQAKDLPISTIFIDDPIGHFDDINILGFCDLLRSVMEVHDCQIVLTTHDDKVFQILERKLSDDYYNSKFIKLPEDSIVLE